MTTTRPLNVGDTWLAPSGREYIVKSWDGLRVWVQQIGVDYCPVFDMNIVVGQTRSEGGSIVFAGTIIGHPLAEHTPTLPHPVEPSPMYSHADNPNRSCPHCSGMGTELVGLIAPGQTAADLKFERPPCREGCPVPKPPTRAVVFTSHGAGPDSMRLATRKEVEYADECDQHLPRAESQVWERYEHHRQQAEALLDHAFQGSRDMTPCEEYIGRAYMLDSNTPDPERLIWPPCYRCRNTANTHDTQPPNPTHNVLIKNYDGEVVGSWATINTGIEAPA